MQLSHRAANDDSEQIEGTPAQLLLFPEPLSSLIRMVNIRADSPKPHPSSSWIILAET
jgi:hypothetical protein